MSAPQRLPDPAPAAAPPVAAVAGEGVRSPAWPAAGPTSLLFLIGLAVALMLPVLPAGPAAVALVAYGPLAFAAAACARIVFEALEPGRGGRAVAAAAAALTAVVLAAGAGAVLGAPISPAAALAAVPVTAGVLLLAAFARRVEMRLGASSRRVFFVGGDGAYMDLAREVTRRGDMRIVGRLGLEDDRRATDELVAAVTAAGASVLVLSSEAIRREPLVAMASALNLRGLRVRALDDFYESEFAKVPLSELSPSWFLFDVAEIHDARVYGIFKRVLEAVVAAAVLVACAPLLPVIALMVRASGSGPILFRQQRVGRGGEIFTLTKFRTMRDAGESQEWATVHADRITPAGRLLRRFRADEIPQLWAVVRGHMSLVGPRPEQPAIVERLTEEIEFYSARHHVRPGLTGWAQVNHGYGGSLAATLEKLQYEVFYIKHQSLRLDLRILAATFRTVLSGRGA